MDYSDNYFSLSTSSKEDNFLYTPFADTTKKGRNSPVQEKTMSDDLSIFTEENRDQFWPSENLCDDFDLIRILRDSPEEPFELEEAEQNAPLTLNEKKILNQALKGAVRNRSPNLIKGLLDLGADPNFMNGANDLAPLFLCAMHPDLKCFNALISKGACPETRNGEGITALHMAITKAHLSMIKALIELKPEIFNFLDNQNISLNKTFNPLYIAIFYESAPVLRYFFTTMPPALLLKMLDQCYPLHVAASSAKLRSFKALLEFIPFNHKNEKGETPLMLLTNGNNNNPKIVAKIVQLLKECENNEREQREAKMKFTPLSKKGETGFAIKLFTSRVLITPYWVIRSNEVDPANLLLPDSNMKNFNVTVTPTPVSSRKNRSK